MDGEFPIALVLVFGGRPPGVKDIEKSGCFSILSELIRKTRSLSFLSGADSA